MKKCTKCGIEKSLSEFSKHGSKEGYLRPDCKVCKAESDREYRKRNLEKLKIKRARHYQENKEYYKRKARLWAESNPERVADNKSRYYQENKQRIAEYGITYRQKNREKISLYRQENRERRAELNSRWYQENRERRAEYSAGYYQQTISEQPACVYQIINDKNGKIYIGETLRGEIRWKQHLKELRGGYHINSKLQEDYDKFGKEAFRWEILKEFPKDKETLLLEEARTINKFLKEDKELYNLTLTIEQLKLLQENGE
jgi:hypothetical protein